MLLLSQHVPNARLQLGLDPAIIIGEMVELLAAVNNVGIVERDLRYQRSDTLRNA